MSSMSLGRYKCRVPITRQTREGLKYTKRWEDREVEVFVDPQALAKWHGGDAHNSPGGRVRLSPEIEIVAVQGVKKKGGEP